MALSKAFHQGFVSCSIGGIDPIAVLQLAWEIVSSTLILAHHEYLG